MRGRRVRTREIGANHMQRWLSSRTEPNRVESQTQLSRSRLDWVELEPNTGLVQLDSIKSNRTETPLDSTRSNSNRTGPLFDSTRLDSIHIAGIGYPFQLPLFSFVCFPNQICMGFTERPHVQLQPCLAHHCSKLMMYALMSRYLRSWLWMNWKRKETSMATLKATQLEKAYALMELLGAILHR